MRDHSDDEEGFIPSDLEIRNKYTLKLAAIDPKHPPPTHHNHVKYRFADHFIKKEHPLCLITPLSLPSEPTASALPLKREQSRQQWEHPFRYYCGSKQFDLAYSKHGDQPLMNERECIKNQVSLLNIEDKHSPSLKELKSFEYEQPEKPSNSDGLIFDSKFQNANLHCAFRRRGENEYHLFMQNDTNTVGYNQWFHFAVRNARQQTKYTFKLCNYRKRLRFFEEGQRIAMFSLKDAEQTKNGWRLSGHNFAVEQSDIRTSQDKKFYTVSFRIEFPHDNDYVVLASSLPYSYSKLLQQLNNIQAEASKNSTVKFKVETGATSLCCNSVPKVTITARNPNTETAGLRQSQRREKKLIVIMARQHPGEVCSSYMAEGFMRNLIKDTPQAKYILQNYVVKIFPMINVDGVIYGNFRCDVTGVDLNRRWKEPSRIFHPHLFEIKKKLTSFNKKWKIQLCLDLHGHSKKYNIFCYACKHNSYTCRILPLLIEKNTHLFQMSSCTFGLSKDKESTARAAISKIIKSQNVLTIETSSFGWGSSENARQFNPIDLYKATQSMCVAMRHFVDKSSACYLQVEQNLHSNFDKFKEYDRQNEVESGSDSEPEEDEIDFKQKLATIVDKKYEQEYKSFIKEDLTAHLHCSQLVFNQQDEHQKRNKSISSKDLQRNQNSELEKSRKILEQSSRKIVRITRKNIPMNATEEKKSLSINHSQIGHQLNYTFRQPPNQKNNKTTLRDKKSVSTIKEQKHNSQTLTINSRQLREAAREEVGRSSIFKEAHRDEQKKAIQSFVQRFQKFIPSNIALKNNKAKYDLLEEGLENDDSSLQINLMFENKRKLELQRIKKSIEESTEIVERQGKLKKLVKKEPIIDFRRFKQMEKTKQSKRLGEFSERYLDSQF